MLRRVKVIKVKQRNRKSRGQSLVEFALVGVFLFFLLLGILEAGRFLFTYSVITNAAQEGSRYGIAQPRAAIRTSENVPARLGATPTYIPELVVADGECNIIDKAREKVFGVDRREVNVAVWYDEGDNTPIAVTSDINDATYHEAIIVKGNRVVVETSYKFQFIIPFISKFVPNGIDVKMRSARTILNSPEYNNNIPSCEIIMAPAPTFTPAPSPTATATATATDTATATNTATATATTAPCGLQNPSACRVGTGANEHWQAYVRIRGYTGPGQTVRAQISATKGGNMTCVSDGSGNADCTFDSLLAGLGNGGRASSGDRVDFILNDTRCNPRIGVDAGFGATCGSVPTATRTNTPTITATATNTAISTATNTAPAAATATITNTPTETPIPTETSTPGPPTETPTQVPPTETPTQIPPTETPTQLPPTNTVTATPTQLPLTLTFVAVKPNGNNKPLYIRATVRRGTVGVTAATLTGNAAGTPLTGWTAGVTPGDYILCPVPGATFDGTVSISITATEGASSVTTTGSSSTGGSCP